MNNNISQEYPNLHPSLRDRFTPLPASADEMTQADIDRVFAPDNVKRVAQRLIDLNTDRMMMNTGG